MPIEIVSKCDATTTVVTPSAWLEEYWRPENWTTTSTCVFEYTRRTLANGMPVFKVVVIAKDFSAAILCLKGDDGTKVCMPLGIPKRDVFNERWVLQCEAADWYGCSRNYISPNWSIYVHSIMEMIQTLVYGVSQDLHDLKRSDKLAAAFDLMAQLQHFCDTPHHQVKTLIERIHAHDRLSDTMQKLMAAILLRTDLGNEVLTHMLGTAFSRNEKYTRGNADLRSLVGLTVFMPLFGKYHMSDAEELIDSKQRSLAMLREAVAAFNCMAAMFRKGKRDAAKAVMEKVFMTGRFEMPAWQAVAAVTPVEEKEWKNYGIGILIHKDFQSKCRPIAGSGVRVTADATKRVQIALDPTAQDCKGWSMVFHHKIPQQPITLEYGKLLKETLNHCIGRGDRVTVCVKDGDIEVCMGKSTHITVPLIDRDEKIFLKMQATTVTIAGADDYIPPAWDNTCCICLDDIQVLQRIRRLSCKHHFHQECMDEYMRVSGNDRCPTCRIGSIGSRR
jgi:hypothetical protein